MRTRTRPQLEIVTIGNELLLGETVDSNAAWLGRRLSAEGIRVVRRATVGDRAADIREAVSTALDRSGAVLCTGGLGPTRDDVTKKVVAELFGVPLRLDEAMLERLRRRFEELGRASMAESNRTQAEVPEGATVFENARGTAPGLAIQREDGGVVVLLPGVPGEMRGLVEDHVLGYLRRLWPERNRPIRHRTVRTTGMPESELADRLDPVLADLMPLDVAFLPSPVGVDLRLTSWAALPESDVDAAFEAAERRLRELIGRSVYGTDDVDLADAVAERMRAAGATLAAAESCTGGLIAQRLTDRAGASDFFVGGVVAYSNAAKAALLDVDAADIERDGAVSESVVRAMARGAAAGFGSDCAIAVTGVAGPGGGTEEKPVGTVWIAALVRDRVEARLLRLPGDRAEVRERTAQAALALLWRELGRSEGDR